MTRHDFLSRLSLDKMTKTVTSCDWVVSNVTERSLQEFVDMGVLPSKDAIHWQVPGADVPPRPKEGEVIVFLITCSEASHRPAQSSSVTF